MKRAAAILLLFLTLTMGRGILPWLDAGETAPKAPLRLREGTQLTGQLGVFQANGDRAAFAFEGGGPTLMVLESLALERIGRVLQESTDPVLWSVDGLVTEYQGVNYVLVTRAIVRRQQHASP